MATVNLGRIKPVFRGYYKSTSGDDIVTFGGETFTAIGQHNLILQLILLKTCG